MTQVTVLGTGAWGTTLAQVLCDAGHEVLMWGRNTEVVDEINSSRSNHKFLPGIFLPENLRATTDVTTAFTFGKAIVLAVPAQSLRENLRSWKPIFPAGVPIISTLKGIEAETMSRMTEVIVEELGTDELLIGLITARILLGNYPYVSQPEQLLPLLMKFCSI